MILGQNPWDVYDPEMTVISFNTENNKPLANLIHIGTHCTAAGISHEISRDWAGVMADRLEKQSGGMSLFFNGTAGDVAPRMANAGSTGNLELAMELGGLAGIDAGRAWKTIRTFRDEPLAFVTGDITVPYEPAIPKDEIPGRLAAVKITSKSGWSWEINSLETLADLYKTGNTGPDSLTYKQTIVRIGPAVLVPFPFEVSTEIGMRLRNYSSFGHTLLLSCTNGSNSYLPAQSQLCRGGYEVESFRWFRHRQLPDNADTLIIERNLQLMEKL